MHIINRALLVKLAWKLCSDKTSIMFIYLQAKYFPDGEIFDPEKKYNSTWSWNSINSELQFVQKFSCSYTGNGESIYIWKHMWISEIRGPPQPKIVCLINHNYTFVKQLINDDNATWNINLLKELFDPPIVELILHIFIHQNCDDKLVWLLEKNECFYVKSCYRKMYEEIHIPQSVGPRLQKIYTKLWKVPILPRILQFIWKAISGLLPTRMALGQAVVGDNDLRALCDQHSESATHLIMECSFFRLISEQEVVKRSIISWCIWTVRCEKVFQQSNPNPERTIQKCRLLIEEHASRKSYMPKTMQGVNRRNLYWIPPPLNYVTINCDGSFLDHNKYGGIGLIIRNYAGEQQGARCIHLKNIRSAEKAECIRLWEAVKWVKDLQLENVQFDLDAKVVVEAVNKDNNYVDWILLNYIKNIKSFFSSYSSWKCYYIPKERNKVVDILSKLSRKEELSMSWTESTPVVIRSQLLLDSTHVTDDQMQ
ncbi:uncharacterized protein LOC113294695 [Papaver somniferum]|uniref:uncharacterized protein LOC113294695 n=1 Tax=Papaver somniferum TaxID=3469 RepID=UPI000E6F7083|nr:uncharacterized protein LOC113294695 [Papaver somniferum]